MKSLGLEQVARRILLLDQLGSDRTMFNGSPEGSITFRLTPEDRALIVDHAFAVDTQLIRKLRFGVMDAEKLTFTFLTPDFIALIDSLASEAGHAATRQLRKHFSRIYDELASILDVFMACCQDSDIEIGEGPRDGFHREVREALQCESFRDLNEVNRRLDNLREAYNRRPQPELGGLSPSQVYHLVYGNWKGQDASVFLNRHISLTDLSEAEFLINARRFLCALQESKGTKATTAGNLNRKFVRQLVESMTWPQGYLEDLRSLKAVWNEEDVFLLHILRVVIGLAGLSRKFKGSFRITRKGERLIKESAAGELYATLFETFFRKFNLAYLDRLEECSGVQQMIAYSLFMAGRNASNWISPRQLAQKVLLPAVSEEISRLPFGSDEQVWISEARVLQPLVRFGLLERQHPEEKALIRYAIGPVRKTTLFDVFLDFNLGHN